MNRFLRFFITALAFSNRNAAIASGQINEVEVDDNGAEISTNPLVNPPVNQAENNVPRLTTLHFGKGIYPYSFQSSAEDRPYRLYDENVKDSSLLVSSLDTDRVVFHAHGSSDGKQALDRIQTGIQSDDLAALRYPNAKFIYAFGCRIGSDLETNFRDNSLKPGQILMIFGGDKINHAAIIDDAISYLVDVKNTNFFPRPIDVGIIAKDEFAKSTVSINSRALFLKDLEDEMEDGGDLFHLISTRTADQLQYFKETFPNNPEVISELELMGFRDFSQITDPAQKEDMVKEYFNTALKAEIGNKRIKDPYSEEQQNLITNAIESKYFDPAYTTRIDGEGILHIAAKMGDKEITELLIEKGVDINGRNSHGMAPLYVLALDSNLAGIENLVERGATVDLANYENRTALHAAAQNGHEKVAEYLLKAGADQNNLDKHGSTPLCVAAEFGNVEVVKVLVQNSTKEQLNAVNQDGATPLLKASQHGHEKVVESLIKAGADQYKQDNVGATPLHLAAKFGHVEAVKVLARTSPQLDILNKQGVTPLLLAINSYILGNQTSPTIFETITILLENGANPESENGVHGTCYQFLERRGEKDLLKKVKECRNEYLEGQNPNGSVKNARTEEMHHGQERREL